MVRIHNFESSFLDHLGDRNPNDPFLARDLLKKGAPEVRRSASVETVKWEITMRSPFNRDYLLSEEAKDPAKLRIIIARVKELAVFYEDADLLALAERTQVGKIEVNALRREAHRFLTNKLLNEKSA